MFALLTSLFLYVLYLTPANGAIIESKGFCSISPYSYQQAVLTKPELKPKFDAISSLGIATWYQSYQDLPILNQLVTTCPNNTILTIVIQSRVWACANTPATFSFYNQFISNLTQTFTTASQKSQKIFVILEPGLFDYFSDCDNAISAYQTFGATLLEARNVLPNVGIYYTSLWHKYAPRMTPSNQTYSQLLTNALAYSSGFALNVGSFLPVQPNVVLSGHILSSIKSMNPSISSVSFIVDTSRNFKPPPSFTSCDPVVSGCISQEILNDVCNPVWAGIGLPPGVANELYRPIEYFIWAKPIGESDDCPTLTLTPGEFSTDLFNQIWKNGYYMASSTSSPPAVTPSSPASPTTPPSSSSSSKSNTNTQSNQTTSSKASGLSTGAIIGIAVGGAVAVLICVGVLYRFRTKGTSSAPAVDTTEPSTEYRAM